MRMRRELSPQELERGTNPVPFYRSTKKTLGVLFSLSILGGGIYAVYLDPNQTLGVLGVWAAYGGALLGIKTLGGVANRMTNPPSIGSTPNSARPVEPVEVEK
jgi:hypothetical protein